MAETLLNDLANPKTPFELKMFYGDDDTWRYYVDPETGQQYLNQFIKGRQTRLKLFILSFNPDFEGGNAIKFSDGDEPGAGDQYIIKWNPEDEFGGTQGYEGISGINKINDEYR
jgi:hypothetical protein